MGGTKGVLMSEITLSMSRLYAHCVQQSYFVWVATVRTTCKKKRYVIWNAAIVVKLAFISSIQYFINYNNTNNDSYIKYNKYIN